METITNEIYRRNEDGTTTLIKSEVIEVQGPTTEELIAQKEAELLEMYNELKALKGE